MNQPTPTLSKQALYALAELDMLDGATDAAKEIGRAQAEMEVALGTQSRSLAGARCTIAAARLIRAAELFAEVAPAESTEHPNAPGPAPQGATQGLEQAGVGAGSEPAAPIPPQAGPSPAPADHSLGMYDATDGVKS